jgi:hypothetical protein
MAWSATFIAALAERRQRPRLVLRAVSVAGLDGAWVITGDPSLADRAYVVMASPIDFAGAEVSPRDWTSTFGQLSIGVAGDISALMGELVKGQLVELCVGWEGWSYGQFEVVWRGQVQGITGWGKNHKLVCRDLCYALGSRLVTSANGLFSSCGGTVTGPVSTALTAGYFPAGATVTVTTTAQFENNGTNGAIYIVPTTGDPYYLTYTGTTPTTFTGCSAAGKFGTGAVHAVVGDLVYSMAYLADHPIDLARTVLLSTGVAGANGTYDKLPDDWSYALPKDWVDHDDCDAMVAKTQPASGSDDWNVVATPPQADGFSWLSGIISQGGYFITERMGRLTVRAALDPWTTSNTSGCPTITTGDLVADDPITEFEAWDSDYDYASPTLRVDSGYEGLQAASGGTLEKTSTGATTSLPARSETQLYPLVESNGGPINQEIVTRLAPWHNRVPERVVVNVAGLWAAALAPGDFVRLTTELVTGRLDGTRAGYANRPCWVAGVSPDWLRCRVRLSLRALPSHAEASQSGL